MYKYMFGVRRMRSRLYFTVKTARCEYILYKCIVSCKYSVFKSYLKTYEKHQSIVTLSTIKYLSIFHAIYREVVIK